MTPAPIDLRAIPPLERHSLIFNTFSQLACGEALELINNHEPETLYFMFRREHPGGFDWSYLEAGPCRWHVRVVRRQTGVTAAPAAAAGGAAGSTGFAAGPHTAFRAAAPGVAG